MAPRKLYSEQNAKLAAKRLPEPQFVRASKGLHIQARCTVAHR